MSEPNITIIRRPLTDEERQKVMERVNKCISNFWIALKEKERKNVKV